MRVGKFVGSCFLLLAVHGCGAVAPQADVAKAGVSLDTVNEATQRSGALEARESTLRRGGGRGGHGSTLPPRGPVTPYPGNPGSGPVTPWPPGQPVPPPGYPTPIPDPGYPDPGYPDPGYPDPYPPSPVPPYPQPGYGFITHLDVCVGAEGHLTCTTTTANGLSTYSPLTSGDHFGDIGSMSVAVRAYGVAGHRPLTQLNLCLMNSQGQTGCTGMLSADYQFHHGAPLSRESYSRNIRGIAIGANASGQWGHAIRSLNLCLAADGRAPVCTGQVTADGQYHQSQLTFGDGASDIISARLGVSLAP